MKEMPEKLISFRAYDEDNDLLGTVDVELPAIKNLTETVKGSGIAGEIDSPTLGHYGSMTVKLSWRTITKANTRGSGNRIKHFEIRGSQQTFDPSKKQYRTSPVNCIIEGTRKDLSLGKFEISASTGTTAEYEVHYLRLTVDNETILEIDKMNFISNVGGTDELASVRRDLGL